MMSAHDPIYTEQDLIERVLKGDRESYYALIHPYKRQVFFAAMSVLDNSADAEDVVQEAILKAFIHIASFRNECKFSTWLVQITINEARLRLRKDRRHLYESIDEPSTQEGTYKPKDFADWRYIPSEMLQRKELQQALARALASLKPKYREVLVLRDVQRLSTRETAVTLRISEANVKARLLRARLQMRDALAPGVDGSWAFGNSEYKKVRPF
jgi:RNA polymerase sigma-70 factor (ECF subfamily)